MTHGNALPNASLRNDQNSAIVSNAPAFLSGERVPSGLLVRRIDAGRSANHDAIDHEEYAGGQQKMNPPRCIEHERGDAPDDEHYHSDDRPNIHELTGFGSASTLLTQVRESTRFGAKRHRF